MAEQNIKFSIVDVEKRYKEYAGETVSSSGGKIVSWGIDNDTPNLLWGCYSHSATLKSVIDGTVNYILGDEVVVAPSWAKEINKRGQTMLDLLRHIASDYMTYGNFAIQVIWNKLGKIVELYPLDVAKCRLNESKDKVYYSKKGWTKYSTKSEEYARFNPEKLDLSAPTQIYFYNGEGVRSVYNKAPWESALYDTLIEIEATKYSLNTVANGFSARHIINYPESDNLTDEQKKAIEKGIQTKLCGTEASTFGLYFGDDGRKMEIVKIESDDTPEKYTAIKSSARENIFIALRATPLLFGLPNAANGFTSTEYRDSLKIFFKLSVNPVRNILTQALQKVTGLEEPIIIKDIPITFDD